MGAPERLAELLEAGLAHHQAGDTRRADEIYRQVLRRDKANGTAWYLRSVVAMGQQRYENAIELLQHAVECSARNAVYMTNLGEAYRRLGKLANAEASFRAALEIDPRLPAPHFNLGLALHERKALGEAIGCYESALQLDPNLAPARGRLIRALCEAGLFEEAIDRYRHASGALPASPELHHAIGSALIETWRLAWFAGSVDESVAGRLDEGIAQFQRALELSPELPGLHHALANALHDRGDLDAALVHYRSALAQNPDDVVSQSNLAFLIGFHPDTDDQAACEEARAFARRYAGRVSSLDSHGNSREPQRRLRVGYVSPNFREGCQSLYFLPVVRAHDRAGFEIFGYSLASAGDSITDSISESCDVFRSVHGKSNSELAALIREDRIDILVDLTMHMGNNRALLFARRPAPVQICWLAYPGTTGLETMDYRITDPYLDPPGQPEPYSERSLRLPDTFWCYDPLTAKPEVGPPPRRDSGHVTFGCLNTFRKTNSRTLELWAPVLREVDRSRLLLLAPPGEARQRARSVLSEHGVDPSRVDFVGHQPRSEYLSTYHRIDVCLDTWPVQGHTTSLDALWMGVPVISLVGPTVLGRAASTFAANLGLAELVAETPMDFQKAAIDLARDDTRLTELRATLRGRLERSPLMDAPRFARNLEAAYRHVWRAWCEV
jgi:predicted O-linked N-acetylglucosamine transferase (SPINDLY family)